MRVISTLVLFGLTVLSSALVVSCTGDFCGDIWNKSPTELLNQNEYVLLARIDKIDTLLVLGPIDCRDIPSYFDVLGYTYSSLITLQLQEETAPRYLWVCDERRTSRPASSTFKAGDTILIYGNRIKAANELFMILSPMTSQDGLRRILAGQSTRSTWATRAADSTLALAIDSADVLGQLFAESQRRGEIVLYCPELYCLTMEDFHEGKLCYYDSANVGHSVTSEQYLKRLREVSSH